MKKNLLCLTLIYSMCHTNIHASEQYSGEYLSMNVLGNMAPLAYGLAAAAGTFVGAGGLNGIMEACGVNEMRWQRTLAAMHKRFAIIDALKKKKYDQAYDLIQKGDPSIPCDFGAVRILLEHYQAEDPKDERPTDRYARKSAITQRLFECCAKVGHMPRLWYVIHDKDYTLDHVLQNLLFKCFTENAQPLLQEQPTEYLKLLERYRHKAIHAAYALQEGKIPHWAAATKEDKLPWVLDDTTIESKAKELKAQASEQRKINIKIRQSVG